VQLNNQLVAVKGPDKNSAVVPRCLGAVLNRMATATERDQVLFHVATGSAPKLLVMNFEA